MSVRMPINVLHGLPDDGKASVSASGQGRQLDIVLPGTVGIVAILPPQRFAVTNTFVDANTTNFLPAGRGPLLNHVADPDRCSKSLALISEIAARSPRPCFNYPDAIARTARDTISVLLAGISGLDVPKTIRIAPLAPERLPAVIETAGMAFPVLVRVAGAHVGKDLVRVGSSEECDEILKLSRDASSFYVTEFRNVVGSDGLYRKTRIVVVGSEIFISHHIVGKAWNVHFTSRVPEGLAEENRIFATFDSEIAPRLRPLFLEIARRLDLDYFGVDCLIGEDGRVTLFEANACMFILRKTDPSDPPVEHIVEAVLNLLALPSRWRDYPRYLARTHGTEARVHA
jgi:glutathione synthase/RimK-type ligase-like ATP-grasp enzyme